MIANSNKRRLLLRIVLAIVVLFSIGCYYILSPFLTARYPKPSQLKLRIEVYDYYTGEPIEGLPIYLNLTMQKNEKFSTLAVSKTAGVAVIDIPSNITLVLPASVSSISFSGIWILGKMVGKQEFTLVDGKWNLVDHQSIASNTSKYMLDKVNLSSRYNASTLILESRLYLARGRILGISNPIDEARKTDPHLRINLRFSNFVELEGLNLAIIPTEKPLTINATLSYFDFSWNTDISLDPGERTFVDLTPEFVGSASRSQVSSLREMLDALEPYGFKLTNLYSRLDLISDRYNLAAQNFEGQDYDSAIRNLITAQNLYRDTYMQTSNAYTSAMGWTPTLIAILTFFSFALSRMITEKRLQANVTFIILLFLTLSLFVSTQPGLRLLVFNLYYVIQRAGTPSSMAFLILSFQVIMIIVIVIASMFTHLRDLASQTFGVSMKNLRRRRIKTLLALFTIVIISASAMCLLTFTSVKPNYCRPVYGLTPKMDNGLIVYKQVTVMPKPRPGTLATPTVHYEPLQSHEIPWFQKDWVDSVNIYGTRTVRLSRLDGFTRKNFSIFNAVVVDPYFTERYLNASEALGSPWLNPTDRNMILIGSRIASEYNITSGSTVLLNDRRFTVKGIFSEQNAIANLKDIDSDSFLFNILDPTKKEIVGGSFIFGSINDFSIQELLVYKLSMTVKSEYIENVTSIAEELLPFGFDFWETDTATFVSSYLIRVASKGSVREIYSGEPIVTLFGSWQNNILPIVIAALILVTNALGTVSERKSEIRIIFTIGASPMRVRFIFIIEGLVLGIIGGISGYVLGYAFAQITSSALPSLVQENLIGGAPFTISFSIAIAASLLGCLLPSGVAVKTAVPSGILSKKLKDIIQIRGGEASLEMPIKLQPNEARLFHDFLGNLAKSYSGQIYREITIRRLSSTEMGKVRSWNFILNCAGERVSDFQVSILVEFNQEARVLIRPFDVRSGETVPWTLEHRYNLKKIAPILREELLKFLAFKKG